MKIIKIFVAACLIALMVMSRASAADAAPTDASPASAPTAGGFFSGMGDAMSTFTDQTNKNLTEQMANGGYMIAAHSTSVALTIGGGLALIYLLYEVMQFLSGQTRSMLVVLFDVGIPCVFAALLIKEYAMIMPKFDKLLDVFRYIAGTDTNPISGILSMYGSVLTNCATAISSAFKALGGAPQAILHPVQFVANWIDMLATIFFVLVILGLVLSGVAEVLGLLLLGPFLFAVGIAFGPVMIAGLVSPWTRDYFTKWVQFIVISAGLTGVINVIFTVASTMMKSMNIDQHTSGEPTAVSLVILSVLLLTVNSMISQAPGVASALFPGHLGASRSAAGEAKQALKDGKEKVKSGTDAAKNVASKTKSMVGGVAARLGTKALKGAASKTP